MSETSSRRECHSRGDSWIRRCGSRTVRARALIYCGAGAHLLRRGRKARFAVDGAVSSG
jgi:hypothetical protein